MLKQAERKVHFEDKMKKEQRKKGKKERDKNTKKFNVGSKTCTDIDKENLYSN